MSLLFLEWLFQTWRINKVKPYMPENGVHLDIGCDNPARLINQVKDRMTKCIGIDIAVPPRTYENVEIIKMNISKKIGLSSNSVNVITMLAVLEHMKYPQDVLKECYRLLKPGGILLITVPSPRNRPLAEFLASLGLLRKEMIEQHENYFTTATLKEITKKAGFKKIEVSLFELRLNTFLKVCK